MIKKNNREGNEITNRELEPRAFRRRKVLFSLTLFKYTDFFRSFKGLLERELLGYLVQYIYSTGHSIIGLTCQFF